MKAVIMSHENGGSYCIDSTGSFHFVKGFEDKDIGTEITIQVKKPRNFRRLCLACAAAVIVVVIVSFTCVKIASSQGLGTFENRNGEALYANLCIYDNARYCQAGIGCDKSCRATDQASP